MVSRRWVLPAVCSGVTTVSFGIIISVGAGTVRIIAGLGLLCAFACAVWLLHRARFRMVVPAIGLTLAFLILAGLALAAVHALGTVPAALTIGVAAMAAAWASVFRPSTGPDDAAPEDTAPTERRRQPLGLLAVAGIVAFAVAAVVAVHYSAGSATADTDRSSSLAVWAYPSGDRLQVGVQEPAGHGAVTLRIVVTQAKDAPTVWNNVRISPGQTWNAPVLTLAGSGPVQVVALDAGTVVATLSAP